MYTLDDLNCMKTYRQNSRPYPKVRRKIPVIRQIINQFEGSSEERKEYVNDMQCMHFLFRQMEKSGKLDASYLGPDLEIFIELVDKYWGEANQIRGDSHKQLTGRKTLGHTADMFDNVPSLFLVDRLRYKFISSSRFFKEGFSKDLSLADDFIPIISFGSFNSSIKGDPVLDV